MSPKVKLDYIETLELVEREGTIIRCVRSALVTGVQVARASANDWQALLAAIDEAGVPKYGDFLAQTGKGSELVLDERSVVMEDKGTARIALTYLNAFQIDNMTDDFDAPFMGSMGGEVRCTVQQKQSNLDENDMQVTVEHQYPDDDANHPGELVVQGGEFSYYDAQRSFAVHGIKYTAAPWLIANAIVARVNSIRFSGEDERTWMCMACNWKPQGVHPEPGGRGFAYYMRMEFQFDKETWDPTVVFIDDVTGKPPKDLVPDTGYKKIQKIEAVNFEDIIGTLISGG